MLPNPEKPQGELLKVTGLTRAFGRGEAAVTVLKGVDLSILPGKLIALKGRSGSGKTTLINILSLLDRPTEGSIIFNNRDLTSCSEKDRENIRRTEMGLIFQSFGLMPHMTAYENVDFILRVAGVSRTDRNALVESALSMVGLKSRMHHRPVEMSGGEQQRTAIARAVANKPRIILADEPTADLDSRTGLQIMRIFRELVDKEGTTIVLSTHDPAIMEIVDEVFELEDGYIDVQKK